MKFVVLYGPPAVGKLTVAQEVSKLTRVKLLHGHLTWNAVAAIFEWRSEPFMRVLPEIRRLLFSEAARANIDLLFTFVYSPSRAKVAESYFHSVEKHGGQVCLVRLSADIDLLEKRVVNESRAEVGKMHTVQELHSYMEKVTDLDQPVAGHQSLEINTGKLSPSEAANSIISHYELS